MTFTIEDPQLAVTVQRGQTVRCYDRTNNRDAFLGWVQSWSPRPRDVGRLIDVQAIGVEAALDWMIVPSLTVTLGTTTSTAVQSIIANATGIGVPLRAFSGTDSTQATPIGRVGFVLDGTLGADVVLAGQTVREAIRLILVATIPSGGGYSTSPPQTAQVTIDFQYGVRVWNLTLSGAPSMPNDYAGLTIVDTAVSAEAASGLSNESDATGVPAGVYVIGGNAAGTGLVPTGDGIPGQIAVLNDATILTAAARDVAGQAYLAAQTIASRGSFTRENITWTTKIQAGSVLTLTDAQLGLTAVKAAINSIEKTFQGTTETWTVNYGGFAPSAMRQIRRLTRGTLS
jgi:hypothetical protein